MYVCMYACMYINLIDPHSPLKYVFDYMQRTGSPEEVGYVPSSIFTPAFALTLTLALNLTKIVKKSYFISTPVVADCDCTGSNVDTARVFNEHQTCIRKSCTC